MVPKNLLYFKSTYELYSEYSNYNKQNSIKGFSINKTVEGLEKLHQLDILYRKIWEFQEIASERDDWLQEVHRKFNSFFNERGIVQDEHSGFPVAHSIQSTKKFYEMMFETKIYVESFYYIAFRLRNIIRYSSGLGKKFECPGIRDVRNQLIEHPKKDEVSTVRGFAVGNKQTGIVLEIGRSAGENHYQDRGFFYNIEEFKLNLENLLSDFIEKEKEMI